MFVKAFSSEQPYSHTENDTTSYIATMANDASYSRVITKAKAMDALPETQPIQLKQNNMAVLELDNNADVRQLENTQGVITLEKDIILTANTEVPINDRVVRSLAQREATIPFSQWNMQAIHLPDSLNLTGNKVKVAILDSGISASDELIVSHYVDLTNSENENAFFNDSSGHGTSIASIIAATGVGYIDGIAPKADLYDIKVLGGDNSAPLSKIIEGIYWCIDHDIDVINMSFGTTSYSGALEQAINAAEEAGIIMVAAAGNNGTKATSIDYPAAFDQVISVGASNGDNALTSFTSRGEGIDLLAPGEKVWSYGAFAGLQVLDGTSIVTAHVTGSIALLLEKYPEADREFIRQLLIASSNQETDGSPLGVLNIASALAMAPDFQPQASMQKITPQLPSDTTYDTSHIVSGSWGGGIHEESVLVIDTIKRMRVAALAANYTDYCYSSTKEKANSIHCKILHGVHNYVANLNFLFTAALRSGQYTLTNVSSVTALANSINVPYNADPRYGNTYGAEDIAKMRAVLIDACTGSKGLAKKVADENKPPNSNEQMRYVILGMAAHLLGDTYAHRTIIPKDASGSSSKSSQTFRKSDFKNWSDFKARFQASALEFRDINKYLKVEKNDYTDHTDFFPNRYVATKAGVNKIFARFNNGYNFSVAKFYTETGFVKQLNNFQAYTNNAGFSDNVAKISAPNYRVDWVNGAVSSNENDYIDYPNYQYGK